MSEQNAQKTAESAAAEPAKAETAGQSTTVGELSEQQLMDAAAAAVALDAADGDEPRAQEQTPGTEAPEADAGDERQESEKKDEEESEKKDEEEGEKGDEEGGGEKSGPESEASAEEVPEPLKKSWEAIRKHEQAIRAGREELKKEREAIETERAQFQQLNESVHRMQQDLESDPMGFIQKHAGLTFEDLARRVINSGRPSTEETVRRNGDKQKSELDKLRDEVIELKRAAESRSQAQALEEYRSRVDTALSGHELLSVLPDARERAMDLATQHAAEFGEVLTPDDLAARLDSQFREQLSKLKTHAAVRKVLGLSAEGDGPSNNTQNKVQAPDRAPSTLTNGLASAPPKPASSDEWLGLSEDQLIAEAAKLVQD